MNGKLLRRKLTTLSNMCKFYWELTIYTFVLCVCSITADPVGEHCAVNIHQIKWYGVLFFQFTLLMEVLSLMNFIERCFFYTGFTTIWHLLQCTCMCWLFQQEVNYLLINFIACFYDSRLDTKLGIFCAY
jgi:hypothetical protein